MGVYTRFKKSPEGLRQLVELLESTPKERRTKMIEVGMTEDPEYTLRALEFILTFEDLLRLSELELVELVATAPPRIVGLSISNQSDEIKAKFIRSCAAPRIVEVRNQSQAPASLREIGGAQLKMVEIARKLEKKGLLQVKKIPI